MKNKTKYFFSGYLPSLRENQIRFDDSPRAMDVLCTKITKIAPHEGTPASVGNERGKRSTFDILIFYVASATFAV